MSTNFELIAPLIKAAKQAAHYAHCPYSKSPCGAAVMSIDGQMFAGCNVENACHGLAICATRSAIHQAVAAGCTEIETVVIYTPTHVPKLPCGACRQVIYEFSDDTDIYCICDKAETYHHKIDELLPRAFGADLP